MIQLQRSSGLLVCCMLALLVLGAARHPGAAYPSWQASSGLPAVTFRVPPAPGAPPASSAPPARLLAAADVRSGPGERYLVLTVAQAGEEHTILGRSSDGLWWRIDYCGLPAWVLAAQVETQATDVPIVRVGGEQM